MGIRVNRRRILKDDRPASTTRRETTAIGMQVCMMGEGGEELLVSFETTGVECVYDKSRRSIQLAFRIRSRRSATPASSPLDALLGGLSLDLLAPEFKAEIHLRSIAWATRSSDRLTLHCTRPPIFWCRDSHFVAITSNKPQSHTLFDVD